ncbi:hypothetical protein HPP92_007399 [Vanilla planifolia]|uniref:Uncharacterized protein n=1 Tax=Vanilla planifolia TaxID=51239 RepID=A0A835V8N6_VANPL|nr:hypothetical protein HPP92_007399 [Vanilla planifolia]
MSCEDCGNQAKKDCAYRRCRTCCKARGFHCSTHVKSTWIPTVKRRERHQLLTGAMAAGAAEPSKRSRDLPTASGGTDRGLLTFPAEVSSPAVFRCVRVSPMGGTEEQFAYQTMVSIGGHVFKGILYDQGPESSTSSTSIASIAHGVAATTNTPTVGRNAGLLPADSSSAPIYSIPLGVFMAGTQHFTQYHSRP